MLLKLYYRCYIGALLFVKPALLFQKINQLPWYQQVLRQWVDDLDLSRGATVLEAGSGCGDLCAYLDQRGMLPLGVDYSPSMLSIAKKNYPQLHYQHCDVTKMPFADDRFQGVICASLINLVAAPQQAVNELYRVCQPRGAVSILVPLQSFTEQQLAALCADRQLRGFSLAALCSWHRLEPKKSAQSILWLLQQAGFTEINSRLYLGGMLGAVSAKKPS
ncbi:MAG: class I SAM-dependent methyltransferase [Pseudomonadales bacterium]|nr:class I SAM-dependent methyltransferase [Pseudomonadales bacterium]